MSNRFDHIIASAGIVPVRADACEESEMVTQMVLGETARVLEKKDRWLRISADLDGYEGWLSITQVFELDNDQYENWISEATETWIYRSAVICPESIASHAVIIPPGGRYKPMNSGIIAFPFGNYTVPVYVVDMVKSSILETAQSFSGAPYLWGGRTESGIDCSGLVQTVYLMHGYFMPRDASRQARKAAIISDKLSDAEPGDLIYFSFNNNKIAHVGFYQGNGLLLHASGSVKTECIDAGKRSEHKCAFNERLANHIHGVQRIRLEEPGLTKPHRLSYA